jgi:alanyl-tRNA synthetase
MAQGVASLERTRFVATLAAPPTIFFATSADTDLDAGALLKRALGPVGGRGGGSSRLAQGTASSADILNQVRRDLVGETA